MQKSDYTLITCEGTPWIIEITEIFEGFKEVIWELHLRLPNPVRAELRKRVKSEDKNLQNILEELVFKHPPKKKYLMEFLLEWEPASWMGNPSFEPI